MKEIDNEEFAEEVFKIYRATSEYSENSLPESESSLLIAAFLSGDAAKAFRRLAELRSGRSLCDQSDCREPTDIENSRSHFSTIYCNFNSAFLNLMRCKKVCRAFLNGGCIEAALRELTTKEFNEHKNRSREDSPTAFAIGTHLNLIYNVSCRHDLQRQLGEELKIFGYLPILKEYSRSAYVPFIHSEFVVFSIILSG